MRPARLRGLFFILMAAMAQAIAATVYDSEPIRVAVVAPSDQDHLAWAGANRLRETAQESGLELVVETAALTHTDEALPDLFVMPIRSLASQVPALQILELPFFYPSMGAVHGALDSELGGYLTEDARENGWEILAYWDEGLHILSALKSYDRVGNLKGREFLITRPDPVAEREFRYWKATARRIDPQDRESVLSECLIAGRAATLQEVVREQLYRVHLSLSLTNHRYEGWVVVAPAERWAGLDPATRGKLSAAARETTAWQRKDAREREAAALAEMKRRGMTIYKVDADEREAFRKALPDYAELLPDKLGAEKKRELIELASTGAATVTGPGGATSPETHSDPTPGTDGR